MKVSEIVFLQGEQANEPLSLYSEQGKEALLEYLQQWFNPGESEVKDILFIEDLIGSTDKTFTIGNFMVTYNLNYGYCGLMQLH